MLYISSWMSHLYSYLKYLKCKRFRDRLIQGGFSVVLLSHNSRADMLVKYMFCNQFLVGSPGFVLHIFNSTTLIQDVFSLVLFCQPIKVVAFICLIIYIEMSCSILLGRITLYFYFIYLKCQHSAEWIFSPCLLLLLLLLFHILTSFPDQDSGHETTVEPRLTDTPE